MVVLALGIGIVLQDRIEDRALRGAEQLARSLREPRRRART